MPKTTAEIVVGANGSVRVSPEGTAFPADIDAAFPAGWVDLGYTSEDGVSMKDAKTLVGIPVWQLMYDALKIVGSRDFTAQHVLRQFAGPQIELAFGGATVEGDVTNGFEIHPPEASHIDIVQWSVEWLMNDRKWRFFLRRCLVVDDVEFGVARTKATDLPVTLGVLGSDTEEPWFAQSNDPQLAQST